MIKALRPINTKIKHYIIHSFDIETYTNKNKFLLGGYYDHKYHSFTNKDIMISYINSIKNVNCIIGTTNLQFDFNALFIESPEFFDYDIFMKNGRYLFITGKEKNYYDTINISASSVKELGKLLYIEKLNKPKFLGKYPNNDNEWKYLKKYNSKDCLITKRFIEYFQKILNELGGELKPTIASCAMNLYRRKFLKKPIYHEPIDVKKMIFESYYGGRTECIIRGNIRKYLKAKNSKYLYYTDFNSKYADVMRRKYPLPSSCREITDYNNIIEYIKKYDGVTDIIIQAPKNMKYPLLPYRNIKGKILFCLGKWRACYTNLELRKALSLGYKIIKVFNGIIYTKTFYPFKEYVETLYALRIKYKKKNNILMSYCIKQLLTNLYGKFATKNIEEIRFFMNKDIKRLSHEIINNDIGYIIDRKECKASYVIPIFASYVTSYARIDLYDEIIRYDSIYHDTDSIFSIKKPMNISNKLGDLKIEKIIINGIIIRPKAYIISENIDMRKGYIKIKGIKGLNKHDNEGYLINDSIRDFYKLLDGKKIKQIRFTKIRESIIQKLGINEIITFHKTIKLDDDKRKWKWKFNKKLYEESMPLIIYDMKKHNKIADETLI